MKYSIESTKPLEGERIQNVQNGIYVVVASDTSPKVDEILLIAKGEVFALHNAYCGYVSTSQMSGNVRVRPLRPGEKLVCVE